MKSITLFLMTQKGFEVLEEIIHSNFKTYIECVIVSKDKNIEKDFFDEIIFLCIKNDIPYKNKTDVVEVYSEYAIAVSWRWLIHLNHTKLIVLHDSLLPKYRGFAPLVNALINKEKKVGVTALFASNDFDTGDIIFQSSIDINYPIKIQDAINQIVILYKQIIIQIFNTLHLKKEFILQKQLEKEASYSLWRDEQDYLIDWSRDAEYILTFINAVGPPYSSASTFLNGNKIRIIDVEIEEDVVIENRVPGKLIFVRESKYPVIVCGKGLIIIKHAIYDFTKESLLPLKNYRIRFSNY